MTKEIDQGLSECHHLPTLDRMKESKETDPNKLSAIQGFANKYRLLAALMSRGYNVSQVASPLSTYDLLVEAKDKHDNIVFIRIKVKTVSDGGSVPFTGGVRAGIDRPKDKDRPKDVPETTFNVKHYIQDTTTSDVVVGVEVQEDDGDKEINFYFVPTLYIEKIKQKSLSIRKIPQAKNNWKLMLECKNPAFVNEVFK